jgi:hypothetical protein
MGAASRQALINVGVGVIALMACAPQPVRTTTDRPLNDFQIAELWEAPREDAAFDLFWGPWGEKLAPRADAEYKFVKEKTTGFSPGLTVVDDDGSEWSVKQGAEAGVEVVVSRILSAIGYHQPPVYYVAHWKVRGGPRSGEQKPGRFRPKGGGLKDAGSWSWQQNPFVGTAPYRGLLALMMLLNETDLKNDNNTIYDLKQPRAGSDVTRWYVVRDLGAALGATGRIAPRRGDPFAFEQTGFIKGVEKGSVVFSYRGAHGELVDELQPRDLRWMAERLSRLTHDQWLDAFRAGGYGPDTSEWYVRILQRRIAQIETLTAN